MDTFAEYLSAIENPEHRAKLAEIFAWILHKFPSLMPELKWNQPMFTDHGISLITRMIEFNVADKTDTKTFWRK